MECSTGACYDNAKVYRFYKKNNRGGCKFVIFLLKMGKILYIFAYTNLDAVQIYSFWQFLWYYKF